MKMTEQGGASSPTGHSRNLRQFKIVIPSYPAFNIYSGIARKTTALGPIYVATVASKTAGLTVEVIDENNYRRLGPKSSAY